MQNHEHPPWRVMIAGDHLQLLYHFDLVNDMLTGQIPWWQNPYEFNEGDDRMRFRRSAYFLPMSGVYALLVEAVGQAAAWNTTLWISVWFSAFFSWLWLRRFTMDPWAVGLGVLVIIVSPYRWISLFGGSPAGMALMWLPLLVWAVDVAVREGTWASGVWAGMALVLLYWADLQVFYFTTLSLPFFAAISLAGGWMTGVSLPWRRWWRVAPGGMAGLVVIGVFYLWRKDFLADSTMAAGRSLSEVRIFSPLWTGFLIGGRGPDDSIFLGVGVVAALAVALVRMMRMVGRGSRLRIRMLMVYLLLTGVLGFYAMLALGTHGPFHGALLRGVRDVIPGYSMIRQSFKIFCVVPMWVAWMLILGLSATVGQSRLTRVMLRGVMVTAGAGLMIQFLYAYSPTICLLEREQEAYALVAREAVEHRGTVARAVAVPLWPGDSSESTVPLHFAHRYGLRLLNGYSPVVRKTYMEDVFRRLESINQGVLDDEQVDWLLARDIRYVLVHENRYPDMVSPFPVHEALRRMRAHPRMTLMKQDGPVYAFKLLEEAKVVDAVDGPPSVEFPLFPARRWEVEDFAGARAAAVTNDTASGQVFWRAEAGTSITVTSRTIRIAPSEQMAWWLRVRGSGKLMVVTMGCNGPLNEQTITVDETAWSWHVQALPAVVPFQPFTLTLTAQEGAMDIDNVFLGPANWPLHWPVDEIRLPAAAFFRTGYTHKDGESVVFRRDHDPDVVVFYGPRLPLPIGGYEVVWEFSTDAPDGTVLGWVQFSQTREIGEDWQPIMAGQVARWPWVTRSNLPSTFWMKYARNADFVMHAVRIERAGGGGL